MHAHAHDPLPPEHRETVDLWVSDYLDRPHARDLVGRVGPEAASVLSAFLEAACHGRAPADLDAESVAHAFLGHLPALVLEPARRAAVPELVASFLGDLEDVGRLSDGRLLAAHVRASAPAFRERASGKAPDLTRKAEKLGRNDPCPCGSGRKYKQCCLKLAG